MAALKRGMKMPHRKQLLSELPDASKSCHERRLTYTHAQDGRVITNGKTVV